MSSKDILLSAAGSAGAADQYIDDYFAATLYNGNGAASQSITTGVNLSGSENTTDQVVFSFPGTYTWYCPAGVTSVSVVCVGGGGYGAVDAGGYYKGGAGGGLGYKNNYAVTPGTGYTVVVGDGGSSAFNNGGNSYFGSLVVCYGAGGQGTDVSGSSTTPNTGGTYVGDGGGNGGAGGVSSGLTFNSGGGGAGGYAGNGGRGYGDLSGAFTAGTGGAAAGGDLGVGGGGVGLLGQGTSGTTSGQGGSGGANGALGGGAYGGGGRGSGANGAGGAVRIIYSGATRTFPSTNTGDLTPSGGDQSKVGMLWTRARVAVSGMSSEAPYIIDTKTNLSNSRYNVLFTYLNNAAFDYRSNQQLRFIQNGFAVGTLGSGFNLELNVSNAPYDTWQFRAKADFFDVVTYTGTGANRTVPHNLKSVPGCIIVKRLDNTGDWQVYHVSAGNTQYGVLNSASAFATSSTRWNNTTPTDTVFTVGTDASVNALNGQYVAYLFANDAASDSFIKCGSITGTGALASFSVGFEPQWLLIKPRNGTGHWQIYDNNIGWTTDGDASYIQPGTTGNETSVAAGVALTAGPTQNGFKFWGASGTSYVYIAIRRSNKPPTIGTEVFQPTLYTGTNTDNRLVSIGQFADMAWFRQRNGSGTGFEGFVVGDRLRGQPFLKTAATQIEQNVADGLDKQLISAVEYGNAFSSMVGVWVGNNSGAAATAANINFNTTANNHVAYAFKRAAKFFDIVAYNGTGAVQSIPHNLNAIPEAIIVKNRSFATSWNVYYGNNATALSLNTAVTANTSINWWNNTSPTETNFTVGTGNSGSGNKHIAYLFATVPGVSKVGTYVGTGTPLLVNCGFTTGARFVIVKNINTSFNWAVFDTARGIFVGNDPFLSTSSTDAESLTFDWIDTDNAGFIVNASGTLNAVGDTYFFIAIS